MSDYARQHDFSVKDALSTGDPDKVIKGSEVDAEFDALVTSVGTKLDAVVGGTTNNICTLNSTGGVQDSGAALAQYAELASPTFTGTPTLPTGTIAVTQSADDNSTAVATTAYVDTAVGSIGMVPSAELTLKDGFAVGALYSVAHGLASAPLIIHGILYCDNTDGGWVSGDRYLLSGFSADGGANSRQLAFYADATNVYCRVGSSPLRLTEKGTGDTFDVVGTKWQIRCIAVALST